jgi:hypothetical protein
MLRPIEDGRCRAKPGFSRCGDSGHWWKSLFAGKERISQFFLTSS